MASEITAPRLRARATPLARLAELGWPAPAWGAIGVTTLFIGITCWWLTQDRSIPIYDAGLHLNLALNVQQELAAGNLGTALTLSVPYPPFAYLIGSLGIAIGGVGVAPPILAENLVFVTLLALGCYKVGRLAFSPLAGLLAVVFALGSPLIAAQFHVFMTDAPETAMVAVSVWLIIASEGFTKLRTCAVAGVAVGLGMLTKEPFPIFVLGVGLVTLGRGGRRAWPGVAVFAAIALALALPWYIHEHALIQGIGTQATAASSAYQSAAGPAPKDIAPPRLSSANLEWYMWNLDNVELGLPLLLLAAAGFIWTVAGFVPRRVRSSAAEEARPGARTSKVGSGSRQGRSGRGGQKKDRNSPTRSSGWKPRTGSRAAATRVARERTPVSPLALELTVGAFVAWLILTETYFHDTRYSMPLLLYLAVFAGGLDRALQRPLAGRRRGRCLHWWSRPTRWGARSASERSTGSRCREPPQPRSSSPATSRCTRAGSWCRCHTGTATCWRRCRRCGGMACATSPGTSSRVRSNRTSPTAGWRCSRRSRS